MRYFIGVDVGTGSVRAALFNQDGKLVATASKEIRIWNPKPDYYQQSSEEIWLAVIYTIKTVCDTGGVGKEDVGGIGFDATCSLVIRDKEGKPLSVCPEGTAECDIIMWMDHRASEETNIINATKHDVLKYTGGGISVEMEPPKLLWLKRNLREKCWDKAGHMFDLCDFLTWRATGSLIRSVCSVSAKWTYTKDKQFDPKFYKLIGLEDLCENNFEKIGNDIQPQGKPCGSGLTQHAADELGLKLGTAVSVGMIDAHCATIGCLGCIPKDSSITLPPLTSRVAMISGTSTCHMQLSKEAIFVPGVWGPNWSAIVPGFWSAEGGQSAAGKLMDFVIETHSSYQDALKQATDRNQHITDYLYELLEKEARNQGLTSMAELTKEFHMWPDFHGNRSPLADHTLKGMISGLTLRSDDVGLAILYLATVQALAYSTNHILTEMRKSGHSPDILYVCGGLRKNKLYIQTHADATGLPVVVPDEKESVLLGAAILGATAAGLHPTIQSCMDNMCGSGEITLPTKQDIQYHKKKYQVFLEMYADQRKYRDLMTQ
ncbi:FGGY carbohydrate kinase domain-containing protein-like [Ruditapes philippinarum]|uniref:FGGY carbohydrate kinase domain-containing protein-like n=1 Tax=Ruditapes philippinarum TaxID=129788 RepID=UPI00295B518C|nr:FGGY carbohydrate kinase domain-containing protein-like [Ruditapes philippinarum]XP_060568002.1 FGGY carbohydrate kinase domain-containing protein-like [Ruditapes philippinarum]XP_060568011.1 FGGY carbohydrate kinase domain-containing protein-like [Ruditapes philippinarum]